MIASVSDRGDALGAEPGEVRGRHLEHRRGHRPGRRGRLPAGHRHGARARPRARARRPTRSSACGAVDGHHAARAARPRPARRAGLLRARGHPPPRRGRDPRPPGDLRARRAPLRAAAHAPPRRRRHVARVLRRAQHPRGRRRAHRRARQGPGGLRLMDDLYREEILEHYKRPHNWGPMDDPDLEFSDNNPLCGDELTVMLRVDDDGHRPGRALRRPRLRDQPGRGLDGLRRGQGHEGRRHPAPGPLVRPRPARDRHLRHAHEVRAAVAQGAQEREPRRRRRLGARNARFPSRITELTTQIWL